MFNLNQRKVVITCHCFGASERTCWWRCIYFFPSLFQNSFLFCSLQPIAITPSRKYYLNDLEELLKSVGANNTYEIYKDTRDMEDIAAPSISFLFYFSSNIHLHNLINLTRSIISTILPFFFFQRCSCLVHFWNWYWHSHPADVPYWWNSFWP